MKKKRLNEFEFEGNQYTKVYNDVWLVSGEYDFFQFDVSPQWYAIYVRAPRCIRHRNEQEYALAGMLMPQSLMMELNYAKSKGIYNMEWNNGWQAVDVAPDGTMRFIPNRPPEPIALMHSELQSYLSDYFTRLEAHHFKLIYGR